MHEEKIQNLKKNTPMPYCSYLHYMCGESSIPQPKEIIPYCWSSIFFVKRRAIKQNPKSTYSTLRRLLLASNDQGGDEGYVLERLWQYIFTHESFDNLDDLQNTLKWTINNYCACWNSTLRFVSIYSKSYQAHETTKQLTHYDDTTMIYYDNKVGEFEYRPGVFFDFNPIALYPCLNIETATKLLMFHIETKFDIINTLGSLLTEKLNTINPFNIGKRVHWSRNVKNHINKSKFKPSNLHKHLKKEYLKEWIVLEVSAYSDWAPAKNLDHRALLPLLTFCTSSLICSASLRSASLRSASWAGL